MFATIRSSLTGLGFILSSKDAQLFVPKIVRNSLRVSGEEVSDRDKRHNEEKPLPRLLLETLSVFFLVILSMNGFFFRQPELYQLGRKLIDHVLHFAGRYMPFYHIQHTFGVMDCCFIISKITAGRRRVLRAK